MISDSQVVHVRNEQTAHSTHTDVHTMIQELKNKIIIQKNTTPHTHCSESDDSKRPNDSYQPHGVFVYLVVLKSYITVHRIVQPLFRLLPVLLVED